MEESWREKLSTREREGDKKEERDKKVSPTVSTSQPAGYRVKSAN